MCFNIFDGRALYISSQKLGGAFKTEALVKSLKAKEMLLVATKATSLSIWALAHDT